MIQTDPKYRALHEQLHKLWSASVDSPEYDKKQWQQLEDTLFELGKRTDGAEAALSLQTERVIRLLEQLVLAHGARDAALLALETARPAIKWVLAHWGRREPELSEHDQGHARLALEHVARAIDMLRHPKNGA